MMTPKAREQTREELRLAMEGAGGGIYSAERFDSDIRVGRLRRAGRQLMADPTRALTLVEDENGVLLWEDGAVLARPVPGLRRGFRGVGARGDVVEHVIVEPLDPSQVGRILTNFDRKLTPDQGLREFSKGVLQPAREDLAPVAKGRILLVIHGTFSESEAIFKQLKAKGNRSGNQFLTRAAKHYDQILAFDHPTLSVSPMLNALDLARRLRDTQADIDVVCHSRGGLVARWWLEVFDRPAGRRRVALVGCPLGGTSLASPPRIRYIMSWLTNLNKFIGSAADVIPFMQVVSCFARLTATVTSLAANTPIVDATVALIPGLAAMSRIENNFELNRLNQRRSDTDGYYAVKTQFEPSDPGWKFWQYFVDQPVQRAMYALFPSANDCVVDTGEMAVVEKETLTGGKTNVTEIVPKKVLDFGTTSTIVHTNYFEQPKTAEKISEWFGVEAK